MSGEPNFLSITTLRPRGPSVTLTVSARWLTPRSSARRALSSNSNIFAMYGSFHDNAPSTRSRAPGALSVACPWLVRGLICGLQTRWDRAIAGRRPRRLLLHDRQHVPGGQDQVLLAGVLDLGAAVLAVEDGVADPDVERDPLLALVVPAAGADREDGALLGLLLGGVRDHDAGRGGGLGLVGLHHDAVFARLDAYFGGGRHDLTSPSFDGCRRMRSCTGVLPSRGSGASSLALTVWA